MGLAYRTKEEVWEAGKKAVEERAAETFAANSQNAIVQSLWRKRDPVDAGLPR